MPKPIYVLSGPNLNLLGEREPDIYGTSTLEDIHALCTARGRALGHEVVFRQSNHEGELVDWVQEAGRDGAGLVLNAAAYGHTSVALHDALKALAIPVVDCHLSNPAAREAFRHVSYVAPAATGVVSGFGAKSYELAVEACVAAIAARAGAAKR
ncbi:MAG TPA: type II 3-dehydroquinate dehydratase [Caulobacteraceae bacterium]|nr:type II 3-dehydroquinate dehydratase [Caulobacteraceae bacterium]